MYKVEVCLFHESVTVKVIKRCGAVSEDSIAVTQTVAGDFRLKGGVGNAVLCSSSLDLGDGEEVSKSLTAYRAGSLIEARKLVSKIEAVINKANESLKPESDSGVEVFVFGG